MISFGELQVHGVRLESFISLSDVGLHPTSPKDYNNAWVGPIWAPVLNTSELVPMDQYTIYSKLFIQPYLEIFSIFHHNFLNF